MKFKVSLIAFIMFTNAANAQRLNYPKTEKQSIVDTYFGTQVPDPYRWLEDDQSDATKAWVTAQNEVTFGYLKQIPFRNKINERLKELVNYPKYSAPFRAGDYYFFSKNDGLQNQSVYYYQMGENGQPKEFINPNTYSTDGTVRIGLSGISGDKKHMAYTVSASGSDWQEIHVRNIATNTDTKDKIMWTKFGGANWFKDGFYYSAYDAPKEGTELSAKNEYQKIYYHKLGTSQNQDKLIFEDKNNPLRYFFAQVSEDERFLIIYGSEGTSGSEVYVKDLRYEGSTPKLLFKGFDNNFEFVENNGMELLFYTDLNAPNYKVMGVNFSNLNMKRDIIKEQKKPLNGVVSAGGKLFLTYLKDVTSKVYRHDILGNFEQEVELPGLGTANGFGGWKEDKSVFYTYTSFNYPPTIFKYDMATGQSTIFRKSEVKFNPDDFVVKQEFFKSKDGTKVPVFIVHKKGLQLNANNPTLLYGYGGFNISLEPSFSVFNIWFLENGGVYVLANLRGGGEYGESWHKAGMLDKKQNVFDDFIGAAEYLIAQKYTNSSKLAIMGGSNGGLLVGACMTQRPDLFKVAIPQVGVMDMLRFHKFTVGWGWVVEYGSSENSEAEFKNLVKYSPLHTLKQGVNYPATMVTTADHDDRVVPAHSFKFAATLQEKHVGENPVLIRIDTKSGHGASNLTKSIDAYADLMSFIFYNMGLEPK